MDDRHVLLLLPLPLPRLLLLSLLRLLLLLYVLVRLLRLLPLLLLHCSCPSNDSRAPLGALRLGACMCSGTNAGELRPKTYQMKTSLTKGSGTA